VAEGVNVNLIDAKVIEILSNPYHLYGRFWVDVKVTAYGRESKTEIMCRTLEEAESVSVGKVIQI